MRQVDLMLALAACILCFVIGVLYGYHWQGSECYNAIVGITNVTYKVVEQCCITSMNVTNSTCAEVCVKGVQ